MNFLVIDNQGGELDSLLFALHQCYPDCRIAPQVGQVTARWSDAEALVTTEAVNQPDQIIFLDLALDTNIADEASAGLERVRNLFAQRSEATWIAYTSFAEILDSHEARRMFHAVLDKQQLSQRRTDDERNVLLRRAVEEAIRKRGGTTGAEPVEHEDSAGMRSFFAVYSENALEELFAVECSGWTDRRVRALSSGYSGSSLLEIIGRKNSARRQIVVKLAPRRKMIEEETSVLKEYKGEGGVFVGKCAPPSPPSELPDQLGFYSIQEAVPGRTLMSLLADEALPAIEAQTAMKIVIAVMVEQYGTAWYAEESDIQKKLEKFVFSEIDLDRARQACGFLLDIASVMVTRNHWPVRAPHPQDLFEQINELLFNWRNNLEKTLPFQWVLQHGDLNPHNVMVGAADQITFIDLARLGHWPVGYDLSRLAIQLKIRLVDQAGKLDWFEDRLATWCEEAIWGLGLGSTSKSASSHCPPAELCEAALWASVST